MANKNSNSPKTGFQLSGDFPPHSDDDWRKAAEKLLKGKPFDETLKSATDEGITISPIYSQNDISISHNMTTLLRGRVSDNGWEIAQEIPVATAAEFNKILLRDLTVGQTAVTLILDDLSCNALDSDQGEPGEAGQGGVAISTLADLAAALNDVDLTQAPLYMYCGTSGIFMGGFLAGLVKERNLTLANIRGCIGGDPLSSIITGNEIVDSLEQYSAETAAFTKWAVDHAPELQTIWIRGDAYHDRGATAVQELAISLAGAVSYVRQLQSGGLSVDQISPRIRFSFGLGGDFFMEIAKLRAARLLWRQIVDAFGGAPVSQIMQLHGRTSRWHKAAADPHVNMLRVTTEALAGAIGGCDSLHVSPFDELLRQPDDFSRRIARNVQVILKEESLIDRVVDPAAGSWYAEFLTKNVAENAWALFQEIEALGGLPAAIDNGFPQKLISESAASRKADIENGKIKLIGANIFQNPDEAALESRQPDYQQIDADRRAYLASYSQSKSSENCLAALNKLENSTPGELMENVIDAVSTGATLGEMSAATRGNE